MGAFKRTGGGRIRGKEPQQNTPCPRPFSGAGPEIGPGPVTTSRNVSFLSRKKALFQV